MDLPENSSRVTDQQLGGVIGYLLRIGVLASAAIVGLAGIFYLIQHWADTAHYASFGSQRLELRTLSGIFRGTMHLHADAAIQFGLVVLIATPVARVALAAAGFYLQRDRLYVVVSLMVLAILIFSIAHAF